MIMGSEPPSSISSVREISVSLAAAVFPRGVPSRCNAWPTLWIDTDETGEWAALGVRAAFTSFEAPSRRRVCSTSLSSKPCIIARLRTKLRWKPTVIPNDMHLSRSLFLPYDRALTPEQLHTLEKGGLWRTIARLFSDTQPFGETGLAAPCCCAQAGGFAKSTPRR
jgi:hypothetical protein